MSVGYLAKVLYGLPPGKMLSTAAAAAVARVVIPAEGFETQSAEQKAAVDPLLKFVMLDSVSGALLGIDPRFNGEVEIARRLEGVADGVVGGWYAQPTSPEWVSGESEEGDVHALPRLSLIHI